MSESDRTEWMYQLITTTETREGRRCFTPYGKAYELIGFDGNANGGLTPHAGFRFVRDLSGVVRSGHNAEQTIVAFMPVSFRIGVADQGWGFVYVVWDSSSLDLTIFLEYRKGTSTSWNGPVTVRTFAGVSNADRLVFSKLEQGQFVYVLVEGKEPTLFYHDGSSVVIKTDTGPGEQPLLDSPTAIIASATGTPMTSDPAGVFTTKSAALVQFNNPTGGEPARGRVHLALFTGVTGIQYGATTLQGPSGLSLWSVTPADQADPVFDASHYVWTSNLGPLGGNSVAITRPPSAYTFAYQLYNSVTGRKSQLSQLASNSVGGAESTNGLAYNSAREYILFPLLELVYDSDKYDQLLVYRTVRGVNNSAYQLDQQISLATYLATNQSGLSAPWKRAYYFYTLIDPILAAQLTFAGDFQYDAEMPTAGAGVMYDGMALFAKTQEFDTQRGGVGVVRWSNPYDINLEQVSPFNKYFLSAPVEDILRFLRVGTNVIGYSLVGLYHFRKENFFVKGTPLQTSIGSPTDRGAVEVGSEAYIVLESGVKTVSDRGAVTDIQSLNSLVQDDWKGTIDGVEGAYDAATETIYFVNTSLKTAVLLWLRTSVITELYDMDFQHATEGLIPYDFDNDNLNFQRRACFVQKVEPGGAGADPKWRVFVPDYSRVKTKQTMLHPTGTLRFTLPVAFTSGTALKVPNSIGATAVRWERCKLYVLDGPHAGLSGTVRCVTDANTLEIELSDATFLYGTTAGTRLGLSPMYARWTGHAAAAVRESEEQPNIAAYDYSRNRHMLSAQPVFVNVGGDAATDVTNCDARFSALAFAGNDDTWLLYPQRSYPTDSRGNKVISVVDGPALYPGYFVERNGVVGPALFPSIEIICPELTYTLLCVNVSGNLRASRTTSFPTTT